MADIERAIKTLENTQCKIEQWEDYAIAIEALLEKSERENPKVLTAEQLRERADKAVYVLSNDFYIPSGWYIVKIFKRDQRKICIMSGYETIGHETESNNPLLTFYDHKPKECEQK